MALSVAGYWSLRARCPACRTTGERPADARLVPRRRRDGPYPPLSCRSCRPNTPFPELVGPSKTSLAEEYYAGCSGNRWATKELTDIEHRPERFAPTGYTIKQW